MDDEANDSAKPAKVTKALEPTLEAMGRRIRAVRESRELGLIETAKAAGIGKGFLWRIEAGQQNVSIMTLARLASAIGTTMADLLDGVVVTRAGEGPGKPEDTSDHPSG